MSSCILFAPSVMSSSFVFCHRQWYRRRLCFCCEQTTKKCCVHHDIYFVDMILSTYMLLIYVHVKDDFYRFLFSIDYLYISIYGRKFNAEFNKLIKQSVTVFVFSKNDVEHTPTILILFGYFHILTYQVLTL